MTVVLGYKYTAKTRDFHWRFPFNKNTGLKFQKFHSLLHRPVPSHRAFDYCLSTQDTKERYMGQQLCQMEKGHLGPTNRNERTGRSRQP